MRYRTIKRMITAVLITALMLALSGCGGSITGTWYLSEVDTGNNTYDMEELAELLGADEDAEVCVMLDIKGGEFTLSETEDNSKDGELITLATGTYKEKDDKYIFVIDGQENVKENKVRGVVEDRQLILENKNDSGDIRMILEK